MLDELQLHIGAETTMLPQSPIWEGWERCVSNISGAIVTRFGNTSSADVPRVRDSIRSFEVGSHAGDFFSRDTGNKKFV